MMTKQPSEDHTMNHHDLPPALAGRRFTKRDAEKALRENDLTWASAWCDIEDTLTEALSEHYRSWAWERCYRRADALTGQWIEAPAHAGLA